MTSNTNHSGCEQALIKDPEKLNYALRAVGLSKIFYNRKNIFTNSKTVVLSRVDINIEKNKM